MNTEDIIGLAKAIYAQRVIVNRDWDKQRIAREALDAARQFALVLEEEGIQSPQSPEL